MNELETYLTEARESAYEPGLHDCVTFVAGWADMQSGADHAGSLLGTYASKWKGLARYAATGVCAAVRVRLVGCGWVSVAAEDLQDGDIVLTDMDHPGIYFEGAIWAQPLACAGSLILHKNHAKEGLRWE